MTQRHRIDELSFALLELIRGRNRSLESLVRAAESFLRESDRPAIAAPSSAPPAEGPAAAPNDAPAVEDPFQQALDVYSSRRDQAIRSYVLFDRHASETASKLGELRTSGRNGGDSRSNLQEPVKSAIEGEVERTTALVTLNAELDAKVVARIEFEKQRVLEEARKARRSRERLARYRSEWVPPTGDEVDQKL